MIKIGDKLPAATLQEYNDDEANGCSLGPNPVDLQQAAKGKRIAVFALPGAFTPTCSAKHVPGYVSQCEELKAAGVDEIWCISVNDAFVMGAWARDQNSSGKVRMLADGSAEFTRAAGLGLISVRAEWASARSAIRCWSSMASSSSSMWKRQESSRSAMPRRCSISCAAARRPEEPKSDQSALDAARGGSR